MFLLFEVNGVWSNYSDWSQCSVKCGAGVHTRLRSCDSPSPNRFGQDCEGDAQEEAECVMEACPECPDPPPRPYGVEFHCDEVAVNGHRSCNMSCRTGLIATTQTPALISCGPDTYTWPDVTAPEFPKCTSMFPIFCKNINDDGVFF